MVPVVFNQCFGWLHCASGSTGVVMCNPYGHEAILAHRGWRGIAAHLASSGIPTLRFDYRGTGDADEAECDGDRLSAWVASIQDAVRFLRAQTKVTRVVLVGIRLGATLAALSATADAGVDELVLLAPVTSGKEYLRELKLLQRHWRNSTAGHIPVEENTEGYVEALGFRLFPQTISSFQTVNLTKASVPAVDRVLIMDSLNVAGVKRLSDYYRSSGIGVDIQEFLEYPRLIAESNYSRPPLQTSEAIATWIAEATIPEHAPLNISPVNLSSAPAQAVLEGNGFIETAMHFDNGRLFGIYCQPGRRTGPVTEGIDPDVRSGAPCAEPPSLRELITEQGGDLARYAVLFTNTAASHHIGEARMWVEQARHLARQGVASLRMDVGLLGDSRCPATSISDMDQHADQSVLDVSLGIDFLFEKGHTLPNAVGICSAAYLVTKAAVANARRRGAVLIHQRDCAWTPALRARQGSEGIIASNAAYLRSLRSVEKWRRLFSGEIPFATIVGGLLRRRLALWRRSMVYVFNGMTRRDSDRALVRRNLKTLEKRGVRLHVIFGELDVGLEEARLFLGRDLHWLRRLQNARVEIVGGLDHGLFLYPGRELMRGWIEGQVLEQAAPRSEKMRGTERIRSPRGGKCSPAPGAISRTHDT